MGSRQPITITRASPTESSKNLFKGPRWNAELLQNLTTDAAGEAQFSLDTAPFKGDFELLASLSTDVSSYRPYRTPYYDSASKSVSRLRPASPHTASSSSLEIKPIEDPLQCDKDTTIPIKYTFTGETFHSDSVDVIYMVLSKGQIIHHGFTQASVVGSQQVVSVEVSFQLSVRPQMAPSVKVMAYCVLPSEMVVAESRTFSTEKCFTNKVSVQFSPPKAVPGEKSSLQLSALSALSVASVRWTRVSSFWNQGSTWMPRRDPEGCLEVRPRRSIAPYFPRRRSDDGALRVFTGMGLKAVSNLVLQTPDCLLYKGQTYRQDMIQLTVFQPFFLELSLPYSIIRGETFQLKATVMVTPAPSPDFTLSPSSDGQYSSCLCANGRKTFRWTLVPSVLGEMNVTVRAAAEASQTACGNEVVTVPERGRIDTVTHRVKVKAEGVEKSESFNWLLCPKGGAVMEELKLPAAVVKGSARASVTLLGDILGRALKNIDSLLQMPYGCGEQNMAILSPNIYILQYLQNTGQLTADIKEKATNFLKNRYQRQLNYKHRNGAYSTFGRGDENTWLNAFVLRSFGKAKSFIYIDPQVITGANTWLEGRPDGAYAMQGKLFNNRMKGGVNDNVTITAYIAASMLELNMTLQEVTLNFLKYSVSDVSNTYATALLAYTFSLAGEEEELSFSNTWTV
ncbi:hypothetical protein ACEWY4_001278 [Coilia grayii]|uniref:Alpha-2-macroglobulin bait region domain-containing protein n=1 Tax=Coilia grayii TaxID=363190 RepID=A0ABD1KSI5_9TELE